MNKLAKPIISLLALAGICLLAIVGYNRWFRVEQTEYKPGGNSETKKISTLEFNRIEALDKEKYDQIQISISGENRISLTEDSSVTGDDVFEVLTKSGEKPKQVLLWVDSRAAAGVVVQIIDRIKESGIGNIKLYTRKDEEDK